MANTFTPEQIAQILEEFFNTVGTRQYIGARYVPLFGRKDEDSIEWDNTGAYEPLTVVLYQGNSYTSRQYVPVGVEISNQEFWALTGNYNAQVEQYRRETAAAREAAETAQSAADAAQADIDTLLPKSAFSATNTVQKFIADSIDAAKTDVAADIEKVREGFEVAWISDTTGTCVVCKGETGVICLDVGSNLGDQALFAGQLSDFLGGRKIDAIVISHYHDDHSTGFDVVKRFASDNCKVYEQMNPTPANTQYAQYVTNRDNIITAFGAENVTVPTNNEVVTVGDLKLRMVNTDPNNITALNSVSGESGRHANGLNAFSVISFVSKNGNTLCFTGDAEGITERLNTPYAEPCTIVSTPHHDFNYLGYSEFFDRCNCKAFLYTKRNTIVYNSIRLSNFSDRFMGRYAIANNIPFINGGSQAIFTLANRDVYINGNNAVLASVPDNTQGYACSPMEMLGCTYYNDEPYTLLSMTGEEFLNNCRNHNPRQSCTFTGAYTIYAAVPQFVTDILEFMGASSSETMRITPFGSALVIGNPNTLNNSKMAFMAGSADLSEASTTIMKIDGLSSPRKRIATDVQNTSETITDAALRVILSAGSENFYVEVANSAGSTSFYRAYLKPIDASHREYRGMTVDRGLNRLFSAVIIDNVIQTHIRSFTDNTVTDGYIAGYGVGV